MALDFPDSPTNGQYYEGFTYDSTAQVWRVRPGVTSYAGVSSTTGSPTVTTDGGATIYTFTGDGSMVIGSAGIAEILVLGGGGGGGRKNSSYVGGGGGAGAIIHKTVLLDPDTFTVTIGSGGSGATSDNIDGSPGGSTVFGDYEADGGGGGAGFGTNGTLTEIGQNVSGGCGGGGRGGSTGSGDEATAFGLGFGNRLKPFAGFDGGAGRAFPSGAIDSRSGGGGGGVGGVGENSANTAGGDGGVGLEISITGSALFYGGGGGGAVHTGSNNGAGGSSIGGDGGTANAAGSNASPANRGSGGGGGSRAQNGGDGSSGVVIVRIGA